MLDIKLARSPGRAAVVGRLVPSDRLKMAGVERKLLTRLSFDGSVGASAVVTGDDPAVTVLVGVGESGDVSADVIRAAAAAFVRAVTSHATVALDLTAVEDLIDIDTAVGAATEGAMLAGYTFVTYKDLPDTHRLRSVTLVAPSGGKHGLERGRSVAAAVCFARDLVNEPGGVLTPVEFARRTEERAEAAGLTVEVMDEAQIAAADLGGLMAVSRGSDQPARFVKLTYEPEEATGSVALVGKGITFDSGGLSIKSGEGMMTMKCDMGGAAAVIAAMCALPALGVGVKVTSYTPMTDNMLGGDAQRPGDVFRAHNGKSVEVLNTDAEGRLVLADALSLASADEPDAIVDLATLTGAAVVALGDRIAALMGNDDDLIAELEDASFTSGEALWNLPLPAEYRKLLDSPIADLKNIGGRSAGALTAGLFLSEFVAEGIAWAHIDIAGPAFTDADDGEITQGGTGFGVRVLLAWLEARGGDTALIPEDASL